jgi:tetratricopeptide (TPR) repeat protein
MMIKTARLCFICIFLLQSIFVETQSKKDLDVNGLPSRVRASRRGPAGHRFIRRIAIRVVYPDGKPVEGIEIAAIGARGGFRTDSGGTAALTVFTRTRGDEEVLFSIRSSPAGADLQFIAPWDGRLRLPSVANSKGFVGVLRVIGRGDRIQLEDYTNLRALAVEAATSSRGYLPLGATTRVETKTGLESTARARGLDPVESANRIQTELGQPQRDPYDRAVAEYLRGDFADAKQTLSDSLEHFQDSVARQGFERYSLLGQICYAQGDLQEAVTAFLRANIYRPDDPKNLNDLGLAELVMGKITEAKYHIGRARTVASENSNQTELFETINIQGGLEQQSRNFDAARNQYLLALETLRTFPKSINSFNVSERKARVLNNLATLAYLRGDFAVSETYFLEAIAILRRTFGEQTDTVAYILPNLAGLFATTNRRPQAIANLNLALEMRERTLGKDHPSLAPILNSLAGEYTESGAYTTARETLDRALTIKSIPTITAILYSTLGNLYLRQQQYSEAEAALKQAAQIYDTAGLPLSEFQGNSYTLLGGSLFKQRKCTDAIQWWRKALEIREKIGQGDGGIAQAHNNFARGLECNGQFTDAEIHFKEAIRLYGSTISRDVALTIDNYAEFLENRHRADEGKKYREMAAKMRERLPAAEPPSLHRPIN